jgi:hypothetical protein
VTRQHGVEIHLLELAPSVLDGSPGDGLETVEQPGSLGAPVSLDETDDDVCAPVVSPVAFVQHGVGLAHARDGAQIEPEMTGWLHDGGHVRLGIGRVIDTM